MDATPRFYDYIVVGCGGIGSGTLYWLSKQSKHGVLGLEQFELGHDHGGSQDHSRVIRHSYTNPIYTKLTRYTYEAWGEVERESGLQLVYKCGLLIIAEKTHLRTDTLNEYAMAMDQHSIPYEWLSAAQLMARFPQWRVGSTTEALYQAEGGIVDAALGNSVHVQLAQANGAEVIENCTVTRLEPLSGDQCMVHTNKGLFRCHRVIVTAGAWINQVLGSVNVEIPVTVTQEQVTHIATPHVKDFTKDNFPAFGYQTPDGFTVYGMPSHVNPYFKIGIDAGGNEVLPGTRTYVPDKAREDYVKAFSKEYLPKSDGPIKYTKTCLYTMTPDRHFVVDTLESRGLPQIVICCGAGHAYKFASFLGKILAEIAINGSTQHDIKAFSMEREAIQNKNFKPTFWRGDMSTSKL